MAENKNEALVEIFIERGGANEEPNLLVGINGTIYLLPRGKTSLVPRAVYEEIARSRRAQATADESIDALTEAAGNALTPGF